MTVHAARSSAIGQPNDAKHLEFLRRIGFVDPTDLSNLGPRFVEFDQSILLYRLVSQFEVNYLSDLAGAQFDAGRTEFERVGVVESTLVHGSIREDDQKYFAGEQPTYGPSDPFGDRFRVFHHFFDPINNRPLSVAVACAAESGCKRSPDWALGRIDAFAPTPVNDETRFNHFSYADAKEALWRALVGRRTGDQGDIFPPGDQLDEASRHANLATAFRSLGAVLHHIQDMAQPQHTRDDAHSGLGCSLLSVLPCLFGHSSFFERYVEARTMQWTSFKVNHQTKEVSRRVLPLNPLPTGAPVYFEKASDYWSSAPGSSSLSGRGLADFSSRSFYTFGTNIHSLRAPEFPSPPPSGDGLAVEIVNDPTGLDGLPRPGQLTYFKHAVSDPVTNAPFPPARVSAKGMFDQFLEAASLYPRYTLNHHVYFDQAQTLIPLAIRYSAGFIDYFFRGDLEIFPPKEGVFALADYESNKCGDKCGFTKLKAQIRNAHDNAPLSRTRVGDGIMVAVVKYRLNICYAQGLSGEPGTPGFAPNLCRSPQTHITASYDLPISSLNPVPAKAASPHEYTFEFKDPIPINASDVMLQIVFRGQLGDEADGLLVAGRDIGEPSFLRLVNSMDWNFNLDGSLIGPASGQPQELLDVRVLFEAVGAQAPGFVPQESAKVLDLTPGRDATLAFLPVQGNTAIGVAVRDSRGPASVAGAFVSPAPFLFIRPVGSESEYARSVRMQSLRGRWGQANLTWVGPPRSGTFHSFPDTFCTDPATSGTAVCNQIAPVPPVSTSMPWIVF